MITLDNCTYENVPLYELNGLYDCKILRVYDGDTFYAAIDVNGTIYKVRCRLLGVDSPEVSKSHADAQTCTDAYAARDRLVELLTNIDIKASWDTYNAQCHVKTMPSFTVFQLQNMMDFNTLVLAQSLEIHGNDKYGRCLAKVKTKYGTDAATTLIEENLAKPYPQ